MSLRLKLENDIYGGNRLQVAAPAQTVKSTVSQVAPASTTRLSVPQPKPNVVGSLSMGSTSSVGVTPVQRSYDDNPVSQTSRILSPVRKVTSQMPSMHQYVKDATDMRNDRIERGFKANKSIQDISNDSGASTNEVLRYKDTYHPTYGDKGLIRNILEGGKNIAVDTFNKAAGIVTKPYNDLTYDPHKANQELININLQRRIGDLTDEAASEKAQQLADKFTNKKVVTDSNGMLAIQQGDTLDFAKKIAQQGVDTSNVVPAGRVVNGVRQAAGAEIAKSIAMTNAKQAAVYGTASTANDVLQGRGITPESLAMNYGAPAVLGTASELAGRGVGNAWSRARGVPQLPGPTATSPKRAVDTPAQAQARQVQELNATQPRLTPEQVADINAQKALADAPTEAMADLMSEARKYKSAEEFVNSHGESLYHGGNHSLDKFDVNKAHPSGLYGKAMYLTKDANRAKSYGSNVSELNLPKGAKLVKSGEFERRVNKILPTVPYWDITAARAKAVEQLKSEGYVGVREVNKQNGDTVAIFDPKQLKSKQQLTDLYNQAHSQPTPKVEATQPTVAPKGAPIEKTNVLRDVPIADFKKTDITSWNEAVQNVSKGKFSKTNGPAEVVLTNNGYKLVEGNHRAVQALNKGDATIKAKVISKEGLDEIAKRDGPHIKMGMQDAYTQKQLDAHFSKSGAPIEKTPQVGKPDPTAALKQEALKYKSAEEFADSLNAMKYGKVTGVGQLPVSKINKTQIKALTERGLPHTDTNLKVSDFKPGRQVTQPLEVYSKGGSWVVENGNHRLAQALANGDETVPVVFKGGEGKKYSTPITDLYNQAHTEATPKPKQPTPFEQDLQAAGIKPTPKVEAPQPTVALEQGMDAKTAQKLYDTYDVTGVPAHVKQMMRDNGARQSDINKLNNQIKQAYAIIEPDKYKLASQPPTPKVEVPQPTAPIQKPKPVDPTAALKQEARKYKSADEFVKNTDHTPQTTRVYIKSKFRDGGGYADVPVIREEKNITLYQGGTGENRQFWTPNKEYAKKFGNGEVVKKTGNFYQIDNGNRMTDVYVDADKQLTDLYNQAHAETPTPQAPKPQSSALTNQEQVRQRGFTSSVQNSAEVSKDVRGKVGGEYAIRSTKKLAADADAFASNTISKITKEVHSYLDTPTGSINDVEIARSIATAKRLDSMGRFEDAQAIYDKLAEHGTKGGQAIQAFSLLSNRTPDGIKYSGIKMLKRAGVELDRQGLVEFDKLIQKVRKTNPGTEARDRAVYATYDFVARRVPTTVPDKLVNIWRAGLLTAPRTTTGNILGNTTELVTRELWSNPIAVATDKFISLFTGKRTKTLAGGRMSGVEDGFRHSVDYLRTGYDPRNTPTLKYDTARRLNYKNKTIDRYVNGIYRWMGAQDQPFYYVAKSEAARDLAKADAINLGLRGSQASDYIDAVVANKDWKPQTFSTRMDAVDYGKYAAYQNETLLGNVAGAIKQKAKSTNSVAGAIADYILPFTQVPSSVAMRIVDRTPLGVAKEIVSQIANRKFDQRALAEAIGNGSFGVAVWSAGVSLANAGLITGAYPSDQKERKLWEVEGKQPYSVRIGDRWYSLNYMQPMGTILAIGKQYDDDIKSGKSPEEAWLNSGAVAAKSVESQSFLQGVNGMLSAINQPEVSGSTIANQLTGSLMPNLVRSMNTAADPYQREVNNPLDSFIASLPVARQTLLNTKRDMFGKDITARDNPINLAVNPLRPSLVKGEGDIVVNELRRLQDVKEGIVTTKFDMKSISGVELSDTQVRELDTKINSSVKEVWSTVISDPRYGSLTDSEKADVLKKAKDDVAESIKKQFVLDNGLTTTAKYKDKSLMSAFRGAGSGETYAEDYQSALSEMNSQDVKNWSPVERAKKEKRLRQLSVQKDFEKDTVSLYGMTKNEVYALVSKDPNGKKYVEDILKYGDALVAAGLAKYNKFRDRYGNTSLYASSAGGTGRRVSSRSGKKGGGRRGRRSTKGKFDYKLDGFSKVASTNSSLRQLLKKAKMRQGIA